MVCVCLWRSGSRQGAAGSVPAGARPASSHRRAAPSQREGAGRRGDGIRRGFRPSAPFFFSLSGMGSAFQRGNWGNDWGPAVSTKPFFYMKGTPEAPSSAPTSFRVDPQAPALPGNRDRGNETAFGRSTRSNVGRENAPSGGPCLSYTDAGNTGGAVFGADVVPGWPIYPIFAQTIFALIRFWFLGVRVCPSGSGFQAGSGGLGAGWGPAPPPPIATPPPLKERVRDGAAMVYGGAFGPPPFFSFFSGWVLPSRGGIGAMIGGPPFPPNPFFI